MFKRIAPQVAESTEGFIVQIGDRYTVQYVEGDLLVKVEADFGPEMTTISPKSLAVRSKTSRPKMMNDDQKAVILNRVVDGLAFLGIKVVAKDQQRNEFLKAIEVHFDYLFETYKCVSVLCEEAPDGDYCLVILRSDQCQIKFIEERGTPEIYFGTLEASSQGDTIEDGPTGWYLVNPILAFLIRQRPELTVPWPSKKGEWTTDDILAGYSARLRPFLDKIIATFASDLSSDWWPAYRADFAERVKKRKNGYD